MCTFCLISCRFSIPLFHTWCTHSWTSLRNNNILSYICVFCTIKSLLKECSVQFLYTFPSTFCPRLMFLTVDGAPLGLLLACIYWLWMLLFSTRFENSRSVCWKVSASLLFSRCYLSLLFSILFNICKEVYQICTKVY